MLSRKAEEEDVKTLFEPYGEIKEIYMIRNADGSSKCAAFLRFVSRESADAAIENLHNLFMMEGAARPLIVKFADNKQQRQQRQLRTVRRHEMMTIPPGTYPPYPQQIAPPMAMHPGAAGPQNVYPMTPQHYAAGYPPNGQTHPPPHAYMYPPHHHHQYNVPPYGFPSQPRQDTRSVARPSEGPAGANLFVYHLPHDLTDADLATAFNPFGSVISAKVYVDKYTGESKGFGKSA
jgi:CUG-BP- and ETR3-like factor